MLKGILAMEIDELREFCLSLPGTTEGMKWGEHLTFMVGTKIYVVFGLDQSPVNASFKVSDEDFDSMSVLPGMKPAPYFAKNKWIAVDDIGHIHSEKWQKILRNAYALIRAKLSLKMQAELGDF
ncbi:MAG: MmcQ/YjbR family DNA-binding protein [Cyclobacteriaceae bacterium]